MRISVHYEEFIHQSYQPSVLLADTFLAIGVTLTELPVMCACIAGGTYVPMLSLVTNVM
jgi:hypothetical protein